MTRTGFTDDLLPCPFCGARAYYRFYPSCDCCNQENHLVACEDCPGEVTHCGDKGTAVNAWNLRRVPVREENAEKGQASPESSRSGISEAGQPDQLPPLPDCRPDFEKLMLYLGHDIDRYGTIYPETAGQYMDKAVQYAWAKWNARPTVRESGWLPMETAPKDGTRIIGWLSSNKGSEDTTATLFFWQDHWRWGESEEPVKRPDLIHGWQPWPQPPENTRRGSDE